MADVDAIHRALNFVAYEADLRAIKGVWRTLQQAQAKAEQSASYAQAYRAILAKAIAKVVERRGVSGEAAEALGEEFRCFGQQVFEGADIRTVSTGRLPTSMIDWLRKWQSAEFSRTEAVIEAFYESPSRDSLERAKKAVERQVEVYCASASQGDRRS